SGEPLLAPVELARIEVEPRSRCRQPDEDADPTAAREAKRQHARPRVADRVEGVVHAVGRGRAQQLAELAGIARMCRTELEHALLPRAERIDTADRRRARDPGSLDDKL